MINQSRPSNNYIASVIITLSLILFAEPFTVYGKTQSEPETAVTDLFDMSIEELMTLSVVVSASKKEEPIVNSPSVIRVITKEQIKAQGLKSLNEVLARAVGFYAGNQTTWPPYGNRGIINAPRQYLMLIDGHPQNSIVAFGAFFQHVYPLLDKVERVEIISGPGSTLWGSDALLGIINIITKDGEVGEKVTVTENVWTYDTNVGRNGLNHYTNVEYSFGTDEDFTGIVSATYFDGDGYSTERKTSLNGAYSDVCPQLDWEQNGEIYSKINFKNISVKARLVEGQDNDTISTADYYNYDRTDPNWKQLTSGLQQMWIEVEHKKELNDNLSLSTKLFAHNMEILRTARYGENESSDQAIMKELSKGFEATLHGQRDRHNYMAGARYTTTKVGPHLKAPTEYVNDDMWYLQDVNEGTWLVNEKMAVDTDNMYGFYAEDNWSLTNKTNVIAGGRIDLNDLREKKTMFLPRFALINKMTDAITLKYLYNTGYRRPGVRETARPATGVSAIKSEEIVQHDVQLLYKTTNLQASVTLFYMNLQSPIVFSGGGYVNIGDTTSKGIEIDGQYRLNKKTRLYGNVSYSDATSEASGANINPKNDHYTGIPGFMYNLGINYNLTKDVMANLHLRGWGKNYSNLSSGVYGEEEGSCTLDLNIVAANLLDSALELSIYSTNILNNDADYSLFKGGTFKTEPRTFGIKAKYTF